MSKFNDVDVLTLTEAAEYLRINQITLRRMIKRGEIPASKTGRHYKFLKDDLKKFISQGGQKE